MKTFAVVLCDPQNLGRFACHNLSESRVVEPYFHRNSFFPNNDNLVGAKIPREVMFTDTEQQAEDLAVVCAAFHPGTQWQVMKLSAIVKSPYPTRDTQLPIKKITEKGYLPA